MMCEFVAEDFLQRLKDERGDVSLDSMRSAIGYIMERIEHDANDWQYYEAEHEADQ